MITLKDKKTALVNLGVTVDALDNLTDLIKYYSVDKPGPAYVVFNHTSCGKSEAQIDRSIMVTALKAQKQKLVDYLATLGIDASDES
jgi:hypothetical protein